MTKRRKNPVYLDPQPSLFTGEPDFGQQIEWKNATATQLMWAAESERLTEEEFDEIDKIVDLIEEEEVEEEGIKAAIAAGVNPDLARDLTTEFYNRLVSIHAEMLSLRAKPLIDFIKRRVEGNREYSKTPDAYEYFLDYFQSEYLGDDSFLSSIARKILRSESGRYREHLAELQVAGYDITDVLADVLQDPALYDVEVDRYGGIVREDVGDDEIEFNAKWDDDFGELVENLRSDADVEYVVEELERDDIYVASRIGRKDENSISSWLNRSVYFTFSVDTSYSIEYNSEAIYEAFHNHLVDLGIESEEDADEEDADEGVDNVVYRFCGTNDCIGGASARNMYVVSLTPKQLRAEGSALILCVGNPAMPYGRNLRAGRIEIFSIRTESGRPKFTIDRDVASGKIGQIKGKLNRLPGYQPHKYNLSKPDEVRLVVEFLVSLGLSADDIRGIPDIAPGVQAMIDAGNDPFSPPPTRRRQIEEVRVNSERAQRMAMAAYNRPWGGVWGE